MNARPNAGRHLSDALDAYHDAALAEVTAALEVVARHHDQTKMVEPIPPSRERWTDDR